MNKLSARPTSRQLAAQHTAGKRCGLRKFSGVTPLNDGFLCPCCSVGLCFMRNTQGRCPGRTPDRAFRCPSGPDPRRAAWPEFESCTQSLSCSTLRLISRGIGVNQNQNETGYLSFLVLKTHRAAIFNHRVSEAHVALRSQLLAVGASEDQSFLQAAAPPVFISHAVPAVVGDALVRLLGQKLQQLHLNSHGVRLILPISIAELK